MSTPRLPDATVWPRPIAMLRRDHDRCLRMARRLTGTAPALVACELAWAAQIREVIAAKLKLQRMDGRER